MNKFINPTDVELKDEVVIAINRVSKATTGGRRMRFNCIVCVGDGAGHVGIGFGKANEVAAAVNKSKENAKKNLFKVPVINGTIPHEINVRFASSKVMLKPASPGTGVIAGGAMRAVFECVGIRNILAKSYGSRNPINLVRATINALDSIHSPQRVAKRRGIPVSKIFT